MDDRIMTATLTDTDSKGPTGAVEIVARDCPLCGDGNAATPPSRFSRDPWDIKSCGSCGFTYITSAPHYEALSDEMAWEKSSKQETAYREATRGTQQRISKRTRWRMRILPRRTMPDLLLRHAEPGPVVDVGCGDGGQLAGLDARFVPHGVEISRDLAATAQAMFAERGGYAVHAPSVDGLAQFPAEFFTAATLRSYLEHEMNPRGVLRELKRTLKPGAVMIVKVPNFGSLNRRVMGLRWCGFRYPDHLNYFTPRTLTDMAAAEGFRTWFGPTWRLPTSDNMWALLRADRAPDEG